ncbi:uncharacterized protein V1518DRAFT_408712 [Limtongia smithiae]|uniref:uncharacterized protein n=1 Tax=Limtongia smithiae TaxID=1125753 RepID=UPI0034CD45C1
MSTTTLARPPSSLRFAPQRSQSSPDIVHVAPNGSSSPSSPTSSLFARSGRSGSSTMLPMNSFAAAQQRRGNGSGGSGNNALTDHNDHKNQLHRRMTSFVNHIIAPDDSPALNLHTEDPSAYARILKWQTMSASLPLLAGALGPVSNLFSVTALVEPWIARYATLDDHTDTGFVAFVSDTPLTIALNAVSLVFGVTANLSLLMNFTGRIRYNVSQAISISCFTIGSMILVAIIGVEKLRLDGLRADDNIVDFSQGYWSAVVTAILYFICGVLLAWNECGHLLGLYPASFILSSSQRMLMLQIIFIAVWLGGGGGLFAHLENINYADGIYYCDVTILTIGLGDIHPTSDLSRALILPYALVGVLLVGLVIASFRSLVISTIRESQSLNRVERLRVHHLRKLESVEIERTGEDSFNLMRQIHSTAMRHDRWLILLVTVFIFSAFWLVGAYIFAAIEGWPYFHGLYFVSLCLFTIGYGDFVPVQSSSKVIFVLWSLIAVPLMTILISSMGDTVIAIVQALTSKLGDIALRNVHTPSRDELGLSVVRRMTNDLETARSETRKSASTYELPGTVRMPLIGAPVPQDPISYAAVSSPPSAPLSRARVMHKSESTASIASLMSASSVELTADAEDQELLGLLQKESHIIAAIQQILRDVHQDSQKKYSFDEWKRLSTVMNKDFDWLGPNSPLRYPVNEPTLLLRLYWSSLKNVLERRREIIASRMPPVIDPTAATLTSAGPSPSFPTTTTPPVVPPQEPDLNLPFTPLSPVREEAGSEAISGQVAVAAQQEHPPPSPPPQESTNGFSPYSWRQRLRHHRQPHQPQPEVKVEEEGEEDGAENSSTDEDLVLEITPTHGGARHGAIDGVNHNGDDEYDNDEKDDTDDDDDELDMIIEKTGKHAENKPDP